MHAPTQRPEQKVMFSCAILCLMSWNPGLLLHQYSSRCSIGWLSRKLLRPTCFCLQMLGIQAYEAILRFLCRYWAFELWSSCLHCTYPYPWILLPGSFEACFTAAEKRLAEKAQIAPHCLGLSSQGKFGGHRVIHY